MECEEKMNIILYYFKRCLSKPLCVIIMFFLIFWPSCELFIYLKYIFNGSNVLYPEYASFLASNTVGIGHLPQAVYLWLMPIYLLILTSNVCLEESETGVMNVLVAKMGKKKYVQKHLIKSFLISAGAVLLGLMINLLLVHLLFNGGSYNPFASYDFDNVYYKWEVKHMFETNIIYIVIVSACMGLLAMVGTIIMLISRSQKITYAITLVFWISFFWIENSIMYVFQPFTEYYFDTTKVTFILFVVVCLSVIVGGYVKEVHRDGEVY